MRGGSRSVLMLAERNKALAMCHFSNYVNFSDSVNVAWMEHGPGLCTAVIMTVASRAVVVLTDRNKTPGNVPRNNEGYLSGRISIGWKEQGPGLCTTQ